MKTLLILLLLLFMMTNFLISQETNKPEIINPKKSFYLGLESGLNIINTLEENNEKVKSLQAGILAEYYFAKQWSVLARLKYFKTGYLGEEAFTFFGFSSLDKYYKSDIIAIPVDIKWEFRLIKNFKGFLKFGLAYNIEINPTYIGYSEVELEKYKKNFINFNILSLGFAYFINKKFVVYMETETFTYGGGNKDDVFLLGIGDFPSNSIFQVGLKYKIN